MDSDENEIYNDEYKISDYIIISIFIALGIYIICKFYKRASRNNIRNSYKENNYNHNYNQNNEFTNNSAMRDYNSFNSFNDTNSYDVINENNFSNNNKNFNNRNNKSHKNNKKRHFINNINNHSDNIRNSFNSINNYNNKNNFNYNNKNYINNNSTFIPERYDTKNLSIKNEKVNNISGDMEYIHHNNNHKFNNDSNNVKYNFDSNINNKINNNINDNINNNIDNNYNFNNQQNFYGNNNKFNFDNNKYNLNDNNNYNFNNQNNLQTSKYNVENYNNNNTNSNNKIYGNNNIIENKKVTDYIIKNIKEEPKIGLNNIGATCYMNATIQCFSHTKKLTDYFFSKKHQDWINSDENILSQSYLEVLKKLWIKSYNNNKNNYSPHDFKNIISQMDPLFEGVAANDSKDLINFILQQLHSELNKTKYTNNSINYNNININLNQKDEQIVLNYFLEDYKKNNQSIISDLFFGIIETITECLQCKQRNQLNGIFNPFYSYNFQIINFIIFPLEEIRKLKSQIFNFNLNEVNIYDCFDFYQKEDIMQGENQMWCKYCNQNTPSKYGTFIYSSPEYFILILNRGKGNMYDVKLHFGEVIDISRYVKLKLKNDLKYQLYAIVTHIGPSSMSGHFISFCRSPIDGMWYKFNDSQVDFIGKSFIDIHEFGCPYILFYERQ